MIARLLIAPALEVRQKEITKILDLKKDHPDVLYFESGEKLGIEQARIIKEHFSLKPYSAKGRVVVLEDASTLTIEAQNALLKTLEELPDKGLFILAASSEDKLLPTVLSRCQIIRVQGIGYRVQGTKDIEKLLLATVEERFEYIEKLKDRKEFLHVLVNYFHQELNVHPGGVHTKFIKELLQAEQWAAQNVNLRAILEYLMLVMPGEN